MQFELTTETSNEIMEFASQVLPVLDCEFMHLQVSSSHVLALATADRDDDRMAFYSHIDTYVDPQVQAVDVAVPVEYVTELFKQEGALSFKRDGGDWHVSRGNWHVSRGDDSLVFPVSNKIAPSVKHYIKACKDDMSLMATLRPIDIATVPRAKEEYPALQIDTKGKEVYINDQLVGEAEYPLPLETWYLWFKVYDIISRMDAKWYIWLPDGEDDAFIFKRDGLCAVALPMVDDAAEEFEE